jgi:hypothetical protein
MPLSTAEEMAPAPSITDSVEPSPHPTATVYQDKKKAPVWPPVDGHYGGPDIHPIQPPPTSLNTYLSL